MDILVQSNEVFLLINEIYVDIQDHLILINGTNSDLALIPEKSVNNKCVFIDSDSIKYLVNFNLFCDKD